jgi:hypothetical protein
MNTTLLGWIVGGIVLVGGALVISTHHNAPVVPTTQEDADHDRALPKNNYLQNVIKRGGNNLCTLKIEYPNHPGEYTQGTVYISGVNSRAEFEVQVNKNHISSVMLQTGGYAYTWTTGHPEVYKTPISASGYVSEGMSPWMSTAQGEYTCTPWIPDMTKFEIPKVTTFVETPIQR